MNALSDEKVGDYLNEHFASAYQKVGTFKIINGQKVGGNVASYFCLPDGSVLHAIPGPVDAKTFLREARWVIETRKLAIAESKGDMNRYRAIFRKAHGERLQAEYGIQLGYGQPVRGGSRIQPVVPPPPRLDQWGLPLIAQQGKVHWMLYQSPLAKLERVYPVVWEKVLREKLSTLPVIER